MRAPYRGRILRERARPSVGPLEAISWDRLTAWVRAEAIAAPRRVLYRAPAWARRHPHPAAAARRGYLARRDGRAL